MQIPGLGFSLLYYESESEIKSLGFSCFFVIVACCCGLYMPNMIITQVNAKENLGELPSRPKLLQKILFKIHGFGTTNFV